MPSAAGEAAETGAQITNIRDGSGLTAEPRSCTRLDWAAFLLEGVVGLLFMLSFHWKRGIFPLVPGETL